MNDAEKIAVLGSARTPIGKLGGALSDVPAPELGATAIRAALERAGVEPDQVDYVIMGNVLSAGLGQAPARQAAMGAGIPDTRSALTVNKVCASGMMAVVLGILMVRSGDADIVVAGGMESMSRAPHVLPDSRRGQRIGDWALVDTMVHDGLWCCFNDTHMGNLAEGTASSFEISREEQDLFALSSHQKAIRAAADDSFREEIAAVTIEGRRGAVTVDTDEGPRADTSLEAMTRLPAPFAQGETVTSGNASQISDGAAALVISSVERARSLGLERAAVIEDYAFVANEPARLFEAPASAVRRLLDRDSMDLEDIDLLEVNEAFSSQVLANGKELGWDWDKVNVNGGAVALGHPIGASGARILVTLLHSLERRGLETGIAAVCHGGGGAVSMRVSTQ
jgi:acetyl-CoA C-acetyltransferase